MKFWSPDDADPEFELTPMIDVVFLLIAFFMVLISFISDELVKLQLPEAEQATVPEEPGDRQYVSIDKDGQVYFGSLPVPYETLVSRFQKVRENFPDVKVFMRADAETPHVYVNRVMAASSKAGIQDFIFASEQE